MAAGSKYGSFFNILQGEDERNAPQAMVRTMIRELTLNTPEKLSTSDRSCELNVF